MATRVDLGVLVASDHFEATAFESIDDVQHAELVARNDARREDHSVVRLEVQARVLVARQSSETRCTLALCASGEDQDLIAGQLADLLRRDQ